MSKDKHFSVSHYHFESRPCSNPSQASGWALPFVKNLGTVFCDNFCVRSECMTSDGGFGGVSWFSEAQRGREWDEQWETAQEELHQALADLPELEAVAEGCAACAVTTAFSCFPLIAHYSPEKPIAIVHMNAVDEYPEVGFSGGVPRPSAPCVVITMDVLDGWTLPINIIRDTALLKLNLANLPRMPSDKYDEVMAALGPGQAVMRHLCDLSAAHTQSSLDVEDDSFSGLDSDNPLLYLDKESLAFETLYHQVGGWDSTVKPSPPTVDHETPDDAFYEEPINEPSGEVTEEMGPVAETGAGETLCMQVEWRDDADEYIPNSCAIKLTDDRLSLQSLSKRLTPQGPIRYMRKGQRCKVHIGDFRKYTQANLSKEISDEAIDAFLQSIEERKKEARRSREL